MNFGTAGSPPPLGAKLLTSQPRQEPHPRTRNPSSVPTPNEAFRALMQRIYDLKSHRRFRDALTVADEALSRFPGQPTAVGQKAHLLHLLDRTDEALALLAEARAAKPLPDFVAAVEAEILHAAGRADEASAAIDRLLALYDLSDAACRRLVHLLHQRGERSRCDALLDRWAERGRDRRDALIAAVKLATDPDPAAARLQAEFPDDARALEAVALRKLEGLPAADLADELETLLAVSKGAGHARLTARHGLALRKAGRPEEAVRVLRRCVEEEPRNAFAHGHLGYALHDLKRHAEAMDAWEEALRLQPTDTIVRRSLFALYREQSAVERAQAFVAEIKASHPADAGPYWGDLKRVHRANPEK